MTDKISGSHKYLNDNDCLDRLKISYTPLFADFKAAL